MSPPRRRATRSGAFPAAPARTRAPRRGLATVAMAVLAGLAAGAPARAQDPANPDCPPRFQMYETATRAFGAPDNQRRRTTSPQVQSAARWLRMGDCLTFTAQLAPMATLGPGAGAQARTPAGPTIPPTYLHVGIVTSSEDEARAKAFFAEQGLAARGLGAAFLGRRIYVGPFTTAGALEAGIGLARQAGFAYPYPTNF
ncbi:MAG: hypothetical protein DI556_09230 [Rhodovulum sulfidophilum]|uniref:SPOR domain-containing protein n=1 Tax=Rhodovulum sulfidophilum TaxID=35806 RepID=A0A2W5N824_RHOSU|nr:MAG: hypothetical protein DI556_09230 [Rhodovulum sulfidophilum]